MFTTFLLLHTHLGKSGGHLQPLAASLNTSLTILSSSEWKLIIHILPPGAKQSIASIIAFFRLSISPFTSILIAWKIRFAGCPPSTLAEAGIAAFITSTNSNVVRIGASLRFFYNKICNSNCPFLFPVISKNSN